MLKLLDSYNLQTGQPFCFLFAMMICIGSNFCTVQFTTPFGLSVLSSHRLRTFVFKFYVKNRPTDFSLRKSKTTSGEISCPTTGLISINARHIGANYDPWKI